MADEADNDELIAELGRRLGRAVADQDFEEAARLKAEIDRAAGIDPNARGGSNIGRGVPGAMGLGTDQPTVRVKPGGPLPRKPDPMTKNHKPGGGRRRKDG